MLIVDLETTGLSGIEYGDRIVEVGICNLGIDGKISPVFNELVFYPDIMDYSAAWVFNNTDLEPATVLDRGIPERTMVNQVKKILCGAVATSYNVPFDFGLFLDKKPWSVEAFVPFDIMRIASLVLTSGMDQFVRSQYAYNALCPDDPAGIGGIQTHRAMDDAIMEAWILSRLLGLSAIPEAKG